MYLIIGFIHWLCIAYELFYPLIFKDLLFDTIYVLFQIAKLISWLLFNNECFASLIMKKLNNKNYKAGDDVFDLHDIMIVSPLLTNIYVKMFPLLALFYSYLIFLVTTRSNLLSVDLLIVYFAIYSIYILYVRKFYNKKLYNQLNIDFFAKYFKFIFIIVLLYLLYKICLNFASKK